MRTTPQHKWHTPVEGLYVTLTFWKGYVAGTKQFYPCPDLRLINAETKEIIEEINGNGTITTN